MRILALRRLSPELYKSMVITSRYSECTLRGSFSSVRILSR